MSFLNKIKKNKPTVSLEGYFISFLAKSKFGKTTFAIDLAKEFYGNLDSTLLIATEIGYKTMPDVYAINVTGFDYADNEDDEEQKGFIEVVDELIETKANHPFRFIIIDTITALERYAIDYSIRRRNIDDQPQKRYTDISDIPWGAGYSMVSEEVYNQIDRLKKNGFGILVIGHEKTKKIKNRDGYEYDYTTFNVLTKTSDIIEREADMIIYGDLIVEKGEKGKAMTTRKLRFRSDGNVLCGTRFRNFPAELDNDVTVFLDAFKKAVLGLYNGDEKAVKKAEKEQKQEAEAKAEKELEKELHNPDTVKAEIAKLLKGMEKSVKAECARCFAETLGDLDYRKSEDLEALEKALEFVKSKS